MLSIPLPLPVPTIQEVALWLAILFGVIGGAMLLGRAVTAFKSAMEKWLVPRSEYERDMQERDHRLVTDLTRERKLNKLIEELMELLRKR